ncbi:GumC family protein [Botryobacter ruber]|uniref:GumC family protein n=1 Tax=Botryobacter ruber TaxID=2171629 RepID=UPI000E0A871B|nr:tyrosine-protein kinase family protein [Botryobacter ruber]
MENNTNSEDSLASSVVHKYLPFWPLFVILSVVFLLGAWGYLHYFAVPSYAITASLIVKDEKKGVEDAKMTEAIDAFTSNTIVENEINVIHSFTLVNKVVNELMLYAPVFEEDKFKSVPAYTTSPVRLQLKSPENAKEFEKIYFTYDEAGRRVTVGNKAYPLNKWVKTPFGELRFIQNQKQTDAAEKPLYFSIIRPKKASNLLLANISIETSNKLSSVINLSMQDYVPQRGEDILNTLIRAYNETADSDKNRLAAQTLAFVEDRIRLVEQELTDLESEIEQYKSTRGAVNLNEQGKLYLEKVGENDRKISEINLQLAVLDKVESYVVSRKNTAGIMPSTLGVSDPALSQVLQKLHTAEIEYQKLKPTTAENNPLLMAVSDEIASIRPGILENIRSQRVNLKTSLANIVAANSQYNAELRAIPAKERELIEISRQQSIKNEAYSFLLQKREETVLSSAPTDGDVRVIDMAEASVLPVSPKKLYIYLSALLVAFGLGIGLVTGRELMNGKLLFRHEIEENISAPIVGELTSVNNRKGSLFVEPADTAVIEQFRQLRATMGLYGRTFVKKKIMVASSIPGEGKSYVSTNLALSLSASGKQVALLDFDLRNPVTSQLFDLYKEAGIIEYLNGEAVRPEAIVRKTAFKNLSMIPAGTDVGDHTELLLNGKLETLFAFLEDTFDYIIIDTPPVDLISDAYLLSEYCDITLLVMRHAHTPKQVVQRLGQSGKLKSLRNVAIVFNGVKPRGFVNGKYGYGYGYGYEVKYGNKVYQSRTKTAKA